MKKRLLPVLLALSCAIARGPTPTPTSTATSTATAAATASTTASADLPSPLPPPEPAPDAVVPLAVEPSDPLELLWSHRLNFAAGGEPLVTIRLMEGQDEIGFTARAPGRVVLRGSGALEVAAGARLRVRPRDASPAELAWFPLLDDADVSGRGRAALEEARRSWEGRGVRVRVRIVGGVYGIAGRVVDNRRALLLADCDGGESQARALADELRARFGTRPALFSELAARPAGTLELRGDGGLLGEADAALHLEVPGEAGFEVAQVEHEASPAARAREDRRYRGRLYVTLDARGKLAAVLAIPLEELLRGLVPSEMPASVHLEALRAQAITARSNVLAQIGTRHLGDPYMICAETHCQAYRGAGAETARSDAAVRATAGEALFRKGDHALVDAVYSAMCGGHGEDNEGVWGSPADPSLRGRPDLPGKEMAAWAGGLRDETRLRRFLSAPPDAFCRRPAAAPRRFRWERRFGSAELGALAGVGRAAALEVAERGVSGRARTIRIVGEAGKAEIRGELRIRRLLGNLPSAMFVVDRDGDAFVLRGGGWGHGAGMCQWGAVGRAEAGQGYRDILRAYYGGAEVARIY